MKGRALALFSAVGWMAFCTSVFTPSVSGAAEDARPWKRISAPLALHWPRDHGSHPEYETEWWYATGDLGDAAGKQFGFQITIFRRGLDASDPAPGESHLRPRQVFAAHLAIVDISAGTFAQGERIRRGCAGLAGADENDLHVWVEDWRIDRRADGTIALRAADVKHRLALDLELAPEKPLVLHGEAGVSQKSLEPGNASMYTSWTRLRARGSIQCGRDDGSGAPCFDVSGSAWFDHEFGSNQLGAGVAGWDWFGLRFEDGRELMLYRLRAADAGGAPASSGTLVERDGTARHLRSTDFSLEPIEHWESALTHARYPTAWKISVPSAAIACEVRARVGACEFDARASVGTIYWEGPAIATGSVSGTGYLELTGYAGSMAGRF